MEVRLDRINSKIPNQSLLSSTKTLSVAQSCHTSNSPLPLEKVLTKSTSSSKVLPPTSIPNKVLLIVSKRMMMPHVKSWSTIWKLLLHTTPLKSLPSLNSVMTLLKLLVKLRVKSVKLLKTSKKTRAVKHLNQPPDKTNTQLSKLKTKNTPITLKLSMRPQRLSNTYKLVLLSPNLRVDLKKFTPNSLHPSTPYSWYLPFF